MSLFPYPFCRSSRCIAFFFLFSVHVYVLKEKSCFNLQKIHKDSVREMGW